MPFSKVSTTQWLVHGKFIGNLIHNWTMLICYFGAASNNGSQKDWGKAGLLHGVLADPKNDTSPGSTNTTNAS